ncbi:mafB silent cassette [Neisseria gonorrhoeae]|nr:mafB silent cassette [Neisseria gonorrhoeae]CNO62104.1 mafB silent cassette [Neisseria gonorrhoeae]CNO71388.1 mafB silent cassette [Neisseria gonorrhoeae]CNP16020.1 mafB silent cassette [Neisseria gonorrhoeae]CNP36695.1 mafB silent cassette [Neisseria gonorrhoeae]
MKPLRRLIKLLAACAVAAAALIQPALAADLAQDPFITDNTQRQHYEPGGKYHLFGDPRGSVSDRTGKINVIQDYTHQMGNLLPLFRTRTRRTRPLRQPRRRQRKRRKRQR